MNANPAQGAHVLPEEVAEIGFEQEVDERVEKSGGFCKHGGYGEGHWWDVVEMSERRPH